MSKAAEVLAELREEEARLKLEALRVGRVIEALEEALGIAERRAETTPAEASPVAPAPPVARSAPYAKLDLYEATVAYLRTVDEPQTARQIADALRAGGFKTHSIEFRDTVRTMLRRRSTPGIRKSPDGKRWSASPKK
jgi:hypothetical protein